LGDHIRSRHHGEEVLALYDDQKHRHLVDLLNMDLKSQSGGFRSLTTWMLGYPDRAARISNETCAHARQLGHPFDLGWVLTIAADVFDHRGEPEALRARAEESERLGRDNSLPFLWACLAPVRLGIALIRESKTVEGVTTLRAAMDIWHANGGKILSPYFNSVRAGGMATLGDIDDALQLIDEQIEQVERPDWEERVHYAEILRLKGWMLTLKDDLAGAEKNYLASLDWAREQQAKSWELRTSTSLAQLWQQQGKTTEAHDLLAPVYNWFTEGFETKDLKEAKALLSELG